MLVAVQLCAALGFEIYHGAKMRHEWTFEEFKQHKEEGVLPGVADFYADDAMQAKLEEEHGPEWKEKHPEMVRPVTEAMLHYRNKPEHEKRADFDEWIASHTEAHEERMREGTLSYRFYWLIFHWRDGLVGSALLLGKILGAGILFWLIMKSKTKRKYDDQPGSPFRRKKAKKID